MPLVLGPLLVSFLPFIAALVIVGLSQTAASQHGTTGVKGWWQWVSSGGFFRDLGGFAASFARWIVSHFAAAQLRMLAKWFVAIGTLTIGWFLGNALFAEEITAAVERVWHRGDPKARRRAAAAGAAAAAAAKSARHANAHAGAVGHSLDTYKRVTNTRVHHLTHAVDVTIPHDLSGLRRRDGVLEREYADLRGRTKALEDGAIDTWKWLSAHRTSAAMGVFTGAVAWALSRLGYGFLRCRSWQKLGRSLKCSDANVLADLLAAATLVVGAMSLVELAREEQKVMGEAGKLIRGFWEV